MFFIAGADWFQLLAIGGVMGVTGWQLITRIEYASQRLAAHTRRRRPDPRPAIMSSRR